MAEKTLNTRVLLKYDTYANWKEKDPVLKAGEVAIATIPSNQDGVQNAPSILLKVGDGTSNYNTLKFASGLSADVYDWAKAESKPSYSASEISGLDDYIAGEIQDTDTQYRILKVDDYNYKLQSKAKGAADSTFTDVSTITIPKYDDSALQTAIEGKASKATTLAGYGIGDAYTKTEVDSAISDATAGLAGALHYVGETTTALTDGKALSTIKISGSDYTPKAGDVVTYNHKEFVATSSAASNGVWRELGDESSYAVKGSIKNSDIASDAAIAKSKLATDVQTSLGKADSALQSISTTANGGLKVTDNSKVDIDDSVTFIFDCGNATI